MADSEDKSERPTSYRLRRAREEGDAATSQVLTTFGSFGCGILVLWLMSGWIGERLSSLLGQALDPARALDPNLSLSELLAAPWLDFLAVTGPMLLALLVSSTAIGLIQTRALVAWKRVAVDPSRMNPATAIEQRFSTQQLVEVIKIILKIAMLGSVIVWNVKHSANGLVQTIAHGNVLIGGQTVVAAIGLLAGSAVAIYFVVGIVDYMHQHFEFIKRNRMSKSELRREQKDLFGDPHLNAERKMLRRQMSSGRGPRPRPAPSVLVMNPTHYAVGLHFDADTDELPVVVVKARGAQALELRQAALAQGIPVAERPALARRLHRHLAVGQCIGEADLDAVAEIFRWLRATMPATRAMP